MNPENDFVVKSTYDETAYRAMAKATWKMFQKHRMEVMAYPALISVAIVIGFLLIWNWQACPVWLRAAGIAFVILQFAVIPLGARRAQAKTCRKAIQDAKKGGAFPAQVTFTFLGDRIRTQAGEEPTTARHTEAPRLAALPGWRFLFFGQGAYIIPTSTISVASVLGRVGSFLGE